MVGIERKMMYLWISLHIVFKTNEYGEITHWETHVNSDYNDFLDVAIGEHGPYKNGASDYMKAVKKKLISAGIDFSAFAHKKK